MLSNIPDDAAEASEEQQNVGTQQLPNLDELQQQLDELAEQDEATDELPDIGTFALIPERHVQGQIGIARAMQNRNSIGLSKVSLLSTNS